MLLHSHKLGFANMNLDSCDRQASYTTFEAAMPSPEPRDRERSRSPYRKPKSSGFKWKEKKRDDDEKSGSQRLERGYNRDRSPRRDSDRYRDRSPRRDSESSRKRSPPTSDSKEKNEATDNTPAQPKPPKERKDKKEKKKAGPISNEPMIIVNVNDRLGTKAAIPCLASDPIKAFKAVVAAHIGRQPHEIMLKRQGERPFKDQLTLADYGVSNGVQLDLELDTGD